MRAALIGVIALTVLTAAPAAAWDEVPFRTLPGGDVAACLRATGPEGGLAALGPLDRRATPLDLLAAGTARPAVRARVRFPIAFECPAVREQGGAGVTAAPVVRPGTERIELRAAVRDPGSVFGVPVRLGRASEVNGAHAVAVTSRGEALVAWVQEAGERRRIAVARRAPGAPATAPCGCSSARRARPASGRHGSWGTPTPRTSRRRPASPRSRCVTTAPPLSPGGWARGCLPCGR